MTNKNKKSLSSPSSLNRDGDRDLKNTMFFGSKNEPKNIFNYSLKRKLNYLFNYYIFPKYGRYTFIYDITENIRKDNNVVRLSKADSVLKKENENIDFKYDSLDFLDMNNSECGIKYIDGFKKISDKNLDTMFKRRSPYYIIQESVLYDLNNIDRTLDEYITHVKLESTSHKNRGMTLFTDYSLTDYKEQSINVSSVYDYMIKNSFERTFGNIENSNEYMEKQDTFNIQQTLQNDVCMRRIVENIFIEQMKHSEVVKDKGSKENSFYSNEVGVIKDSKEFNIESEITLKDVSKNSKIEDKDIPVIKHYDIKGIAKEDNLTNLSKNIKENNSTIEQDKWNLTKNNGDVNSVRFDTKQSLLGKIPSRKMDNTIFDEAEFLINKESDSDVVEYIQESNIEIKRNNNSSVTNNSTTDFSVENIGDDNITINQKLQLDNIGARQTELNQKPFELHSHTGKQINSEVLSCLKSAVSDSIKTEESNTLKEVVSKDLITELEERLDLHKRFWFVKTMGKIDYKIVPNKDFNYPVDIEMFVEKPNFVYQFDFECEYQDITSSDFVIDLYDYNYKKYDSFNIGRITKGEYDNGKINVVVDTLGNKARFYIKINHKDLYYMLIRQPVDVNGYAVLYTVTKKFLGENHHPIPFGEDMGTREIPVHINVIVDFINILMLIWSKFYYQFTGYTGTQAIYGMLNLIHEWLTLETSDEIYDIEDYYRCFRWLRWEAEKLYNMAKADPDLTGNAWIEKLIYEMVEYMEMHHMEEIPVFEPIHLMDEYRNTFDDPSFDIDIVVEKVKGVRKKVIDTNKVRRNQKDKN